MKGGEKVLLVEDDAALSQSLCEQLELHKELAMSAEVYAYPTFTSDIKYMV